MLAAEPEAVFLRGDCDGDGSARGVVADALALLKYNFWDGTPPPCIAACDSDGNGRVAGTVGDAVYLLSFHFQGGPPPPPPYPDCGRDPGAADLDCEIPPPCP